MIIRLAALVLILQWPASPGPPQTPVMSVDQADAHLVRRTLPVYPPPAKAARVQGTVHLTLAVNTQGHVTRIVAISGHPLLRDAAWDAAIGYVFSPFKIKGQAAEVFVQTDIPFRIVDPSQPSRPFPSITDFASVVITYSNGYISLTVSGDGLVQYTGDSSVLLDGKHAHHVPTENVRSLLNVFRKAHFFSLKDDYSVNATDVGQTRTSIRIGSHRKMISDDWAEVPPALKKVQDAILQYSGSAEWTKGNADTVPNVLAETPDRQAQHEILSAMLPRAAAYSDLPMVQAILEQKVDAERTGPWGGTALIQAAERGLPDMVRLLLQAGASPGVKDDSGRGALIFGAESGSAEVVELLINAGANPAEADDFGDTALMAAAASGNPESVRLLLAHGAPVNDTNSRQPALLCATSGDKDFRVIDMGRQPSRIPHTVKRGLVVRMLIEAGADMNAHGRFGDTALFSLHEDAVKELLAHHADIEARNNNGATPLIDTVSGTIADLLIKSGASVNAVDKDGQTALMRAAMRNYVGKIAVLVAAPDIQLNLQDRTGQTAINLAQKEHNDECVRLLTRAAALSPAK